MANNLLMQIQIPGEGDQKQPGDAGTDTDKGPDKQAKHGGTVQPGAGGAHMLLNPSIAAATILVASVAIIVNS